MNKTELIEALTGRLGDRRTATQALDAVLTEIQNAVTKGDRVAITGFGAFEKRVRGARTARNPRTGEAVKVKKTSVPAFKPGTGFKEMVASGKVPKAAAAKKTTGAAASRTTTAGRTATKAAKAVSGAGAKAAAKTTKAAAKATKAVVRGNGTKSTAKKAPAKATTTSAARKTTNGRTTATTATTKATKSAGSRASAKKAPARKR